MNNEGLVKRRTAERKSGAAIDIFKGTSTVLEVARRHDLTVSEVERWAEEAE